MSKAKYDRIGIEYNQTRQADPYLLSQMLYHLRPKSGSKYLEIGSGSGNYTCALHQTGVHLIGVDPSVHMLEIARSSNPDMDWREGSAESIPLETASVQGALACLTIHHWDDLAAGFGELARVLKPSGRLLIFTSTPSQMQGYWLNHYFPQMLQRSMTQMPSLESVEKALAASGFTNVLKEPYAVQKDLQDHFLYCGKARPELYLNPQIRAGISSFSDLANREEVELGLAQLAADIKSGAIQAVQAKYAHEAGDYLFVVAEF